MSARRGRAPGPGRDRLDRRGGAALAARILDSRPHAVARDGKGNVDGAATLARDTVTARPDRLDGQLDELAHAPRRAAMRNSTLPSGPRSGLSVRPSTDQP